VFLSLFNSFASALHPLMLFAFKILLFGALAFLPLVVLSPFAPLTSPALSRRLLFTFLVLFLSYATVLPRFFDRPDLAALDLFGVDPFGGSFTQFRIINLSNLWSQRRSDRTVPPDLSFPDDGFPLLVVGDFNIHHPLADPQRAYSCRDLAASFPYFSRAADLGFELLNLPGVFTRFPWDSATRPSVIDLSFASPLLFLFFAPGIHPFPPLAQTTFLFLLLLLTQFLPLPLQFPIGPSPTRILSPLP